MNKTSFQLGIDGKLKRAVEEFIAQNPRKGCRSVSELTEQLWLAHIERSRKNAQTIRFDPPEEKLIRDLANDTELSIAEIVRRICQFALPKFVDGKADIMKFGRSHEASL